MNPYFEAFLPLVLTGGTIGLTTAASVVAMFAKKRWGIELEKSDRDALHKALTTGIQSAVAKTGNKITENDEVDHPIGRKRVIDEAIEYAKTSVPGAMGRLNPGTQILTNIALSKLQEALRK